MLQLEFDSNLRRYNLRLWGVGVNGKYFSLALIAKNIKCISDVGLEALRILFSPRTDLSSVWRYVYIITFI